MKSFTLHKVDEKLYQLLLQKAKEQNLSMNKLVKGILRSTFGLGNHNTPSRDFSDLYGMYSDDEWIQFEEHTTFFDDMSLNQSDDEAVY